MNVLQVERLSAAYRKNTVLNDVSFSIQQGSLTSIVGPNGAGKSTLIKTVLRLHPRLIWFGFLLWLTFEKSEGKGWICSAARFC